MQYAIAHAPKGITFVVSRVDGGALRVQRLREDPARPPAKGEKAHFLSGINPGDEVYLELGGAADKLALALVAYGANVRRYPSFKLGQERVRSICEGAGIAIADERSFGEETGEKLTDRKARAYALLALAEQKDDGFVKTEPREVSILRLQQAYRGYARAQQAASRAYLALLAAYRDQAFLSLAQQRQRQAAVTAEAIYNVVVQQLAEEMLGGDTSEEQRAGFFALIGRVFGGTLPERATEEQIKAIIEGLVESDAFTSTIFSRLKAQKKRIEELLSGRAARTRQGVRSEAIPANEIWESVFKPIEGCGPLIAARMMSEIGDIRRFQDRPSLTAYAGYHHLEDGSRARARRGHASNWSRVLKQGVYLLCDQTIKRPGSPWRAKLDRRKAYELVQILRTRQADALGDPETQDLEILPLEFRERDIRCVNDVTVGDLGTLQAHVDVLRKRAGVTSDAQAESDENEADGGKRAEVKDPKLAKLLRGVKMQAQQRALRWLGQQFLKHIFREWRKAIGLPEDVPRQPKPRATPATTLRSADDGAVVSQMRPIEPVRMVNF